MPLPTLTVERPATAPEEATIASFARRHAASLAVACAALGALLWPTVRSLARDWSDDPDLSHGFLVPVIAGAILYANRGAALSLPARRSITGLCVLLASILLLLAGSLSFTNIVERLGAWGVIAGTAWFALGWEALKAQPFPLLYLLLAIPPPYFLLSPMRLGLKGIATRLSADALGLLGYPAISEGNVLAVGENRFEVADACSGIRSLMAIVATSVLMAYLFRAGRWKGLALVATAVPVTLAVNVVRIGVVALALVAFDVDLAHGAEHEVVGFLLFGVSLALLYGSLKLYDWLFRWKSAEVAA